MTNTKKLEIDMYYNQDEDEWLIDENDKNLLTYAHKIIEAVERKYYGIVDGYDGYYIGLVDKALADKIADICPEVFDGGDCDHFSGYVIEEDSWNFQIFDLEDIWRLNMDPSLYEDRTYEDLHKKIFEGVD